MGRRGRDVSCNGSINRSKNRKLCGSFIVRFNDDTPTIDVMWIFFVQFFYLCVFLCTKNAGVPEFFIVR